MGKPAEYMSYIEPRYFMHGNFMKTNINAELSKLYSTFRQQSNVLTTNLNFYLYKNNLNDGIIGIFPEKFYNPTIDYFEKERLTVDMSKIAEDLIRFIEIPLMQRILIDLDKNVSLEFKKSLMTLNNRKINQVLIRLYRTIKIVNEEEFFKIFCLDQKLLNDIKVYLENKTYDEDFEILIEVLNYFICLYEKENLDYMNLNSNSFYRLIDFNTNNFSDKSYKVSNSNFLLSNSMVSYTISHLPLRFFKNELTDTDDEIFIKIDEDNAKKIQIRKEEF